MDAAITAPDEDAFVFPGFGNDITVLELDAAAPPVIASIESWMAIELPGQIAEEDEWLGVATTSGRSTWPLVTCPASD